MIDDLVNMVDACKANLTDYQAMGDDLAIDACQGMIDYLIDTINSMGGYYDNGDYND